ncbi:MAG: molybdopterin molybdotransferase MoeA, partial [Bacteroidota bacterium]|nr:molybdopterin molybdotransferase MoeA [Bacteroidota bacterium]
MSSRENTDLSSPTRGQGALISFSEAKSIVLRNVQPLPPVSLQLQDAGGLVLAEDTYAAVDVPAFDQSAMDGYAICFDDYQYNKRLQINGVIPAGAHEAFILRAGQAMRIFTGAPLPQGADTVVMQEKVTVQNNELIINDDALERGANVRPRGLEIKSGTLALKSGINLSPAAIGFLASVGVSKVMVYPKPTVAVIVTGNELQQPGQSLGPGQVYESNSFTLKAALQQLHITQVSITRVDDDANHTHKALQEALQQNDLVLLTGGISVGDYDYVLQATSACSVTQLFHKVKQRPGKPLYFGKTENKLVFGLPGNPSSVLTCFYEYVVPAMEELTLQKGMIKTMNLPLAKPFSKKPGLTHLLIGCCKENSVSPLDAQE